MLDFSDRRRFPRASYPCRIILFSGDEREVISLHTENISAGGIRLIVDKRLTVNNTVEIELFAELSPIVCKGRIAWVSEIKPMEGENAYLFDVGIEFIEISEKCKERLEKLVSKLVDRMNNGR